MVLMFILGCLITTACTPSSQQWKASSPNFFIQFLDFSSMSPKIKMQNQKIFLTKLLIGAGLFLASKQLPTIGMGISLVAGYLIASGGAFLITLTTTALIFSINLLEYQHPRLELIVFIFTVFSCYFFKKIWKFVIGAASIMGVMGVLFFTQYQKMKVVNAQ